jgi:hypothetical protein
MVTRDVSRGGMFINVKFPLPIDSDVVAHLSDSTRRSRPSRCRARVMFSRVGLGMGIQFLDLSREARQALQKFVEEVA